MRVIMNRIQVEFSIQDLNRLIDVLSNQISVQIALFDTDIAGEKLDDDDRLQMSRLKWKTDIMPLTRYLHDFAVIIDRDIEIDRYIKNQWIEQVKSQLEDKNRKVLWSWYE
jgi:hypothetical protein